MEHFVKPSYGKILHFCHTAQGICYSTLNGAAVSDYSVIVPEVTSDFDVVTDENDRLHLVCVTLSGDVAYYLCADGEWTGKTLLQSRSGEGSAGNIKLVNTSELNIFYTLQYKGSRIIAHQTINTEGVTPDVLDYTDGEFCVCCDRFLNIYVLYYSITYHNFGFMVHKSNTGKWSEFVPVPVEGYVKEPHIFIDSGDNIHIVGVKDGEVIYFSQHLQSLGNGRNPIIIEKDNLYILWENPSDGKIHSACSADGGKSFSADAEFMAGRFAAPKLYAVSYTSNETSCRAGCCYGYVTDGSVKFYLVPDFFNISKIPRKTENQSVSRRPEVSQRPLPPPPGELQKIIMLLEKISVKEDVILSDLKKCLDNIKYE